MDGASLGTAATASIENDVNAVYLSARKKINWSSRKCRALPWMTCNPLR